jgi:anti-sigma B factor antagonist
VAESGRQADRTVGTPSSTTEQRQTTDQQANGQQDGVRPGAGGLDVSVTSAGRGVAVVHVTGDVDMLTAPAFATGVRQQLGAADGAVETLVLDLSGVTFLGSAGLAVLADAHNSASEHDVALRIVASSRMVLRPLQVTGLDGLLTIVPDLRTATGEH